MGARRPLQVMAGVAIACLAVLVIAGARVPRAAVVAAAEQALDRRLSIEDVRLRFAPGPVVDVHAVRVHDAGALAGCAATFEAERVRLRLAVLPLLGGRAVVEGIDLDAPFLRLVRPAGATPGAAERPRTARVAGGLGGVARRLMERPSPDDPVSFRVRRVRIRGGRVQLLDEATSARWALGRVAAVVAPHPTGDRAAVDLEAMLRRQSRARLARLRLRGEVRLDGEPRFRGRLETGSFAYRALWFDAGEARVRADAGGIHLSDLVLRVGGGRLAGRARVRLGSDPAMALGMAGQGAALEDALEEAEVSVRGAWTARLVVRGPAPWRAGARRALRGLARVSIRDGAIEPFELGPAVLDVVVPLRGREQAQQLRSRYPELFGGRRVAFSRLAGTIRIVKARARTRDLVVRGADYRAELRGGMGLDGSLAFGVELRLSPRLTQDLLGRGALALVLGAPEGGGLVVPLRLDGSLGRPRVRATSEWSRGLIRRTLGETGMGDLLERLLR